MHGETVKLCSHISLNMQSKIQEMPALPALDDCHYPD